MPFTVRSRVDPTVMTENWATGVGRSGAKWVKGALNPRRMFNADPATAGRNWLAGVSQSAPKYQANLAATDLPLMEASITGPGQSRYTASGTQKKGNFQKVSAPLAGLIEAALASISGMPSATFEERKARSAAFQQYMHDHKSSIPAIR